MIAHSGSTEDVDAAAEWMSGIEAANVLNTSYYNIRKLAGRRVIGCLVVPGSTVKYCRADVLALVARSTTLAMGSGPSPSA